MTPLTDDELAVLLGDLESDRVERKRAWSGDAPDKVRQAVCAFANDLPGHGEPGVIFIGANDDGSMASTRITDQLLLTLADIKSDGKIVPPPTMTVAKRVLQGAELAVISVWPADAPPVRYGGRVWIRTGPRRGLTTAQDERVLNEKRRHRDIPYDIRPRPSAQLSDLSRTYFEEEYLPGAFAPEILAANERSYEQRLAVCRMIAAEDDPVPTVLGLLTLSRNPVPWLPGAYVQFLRVQGTQFSDPIVDEAVLDGPIANMVRRLDEKLASHNRVSVDITSQDREVRHYLYPPVALQQFARNAIMHRASESTNAPVRVYWFDDRIEIISPGGPYGDVTVENFGQPGIADYRNPHLAEAMRVLNLVQRFGVGIAIAQAALRENGNPPASFQVDANWVFVRVFPAKP